MEIKTLKFVKIKTIKKIGKEECYDISVPNNENFFLKTILHHNSGKDFTCTRIITYCAYFLMCLKNPQQYFKLANDEPIDIVNISINSNHAKEVFFKRLVNVVRRVKNPKTGKNWFAERGMDLRDNKDIQTTKILFKKNITAYSLNSQRYTGEGKNIILAIFDEVAEFDPAKARDLYEALWHTAESRYGNETGNYYKIFLISYKRHENDYMNYEWKRTEKDNKGIYRSLKATWEVNLNKKKADFKEAYRVDPEGSARRYENKSVEGSGNKFIKFPERITLHVNKSRTSPFIGNPLYITNLLEQDLEAWFLPGKIQEMEELEESNFAGDKDKLNFLTLQHQGAKYFIHIDLAKGDETLGNDCIGFSMVHLYPLNPDSEESEFGDYVDLMIQIKDKKEVSFEMIEQFIFKLQSSSFDIEGVSLDGYQSVYLAQRLREKGIEVKIISVDKDNSAYNSLKSLVYAKRLNYYKYGVFDRELKELVINSLGKVDHPVISNERSLIEGTNKGSKDVGDAVAGATKNALEHKPQESDWFEIL